MTPLPSFGAHATYPCLVSAKRIFWLVFSGLAALVGVTTLVSVWWLGTDYGRVAGNMLALLLFFLSLPWSTGFDEDPSVSDETFVLWCGGLALVNLLLLAGVTRAAMSVWSRQQEQA